MKFIEYNKHRQIEKDTMEIAMAWYYRYLEKEDQIQVIEKELAAFEEQLNNFMDDGDTVSVAALQKDWGKSVHF